MHLLIGLLVEKTRPCRLLRNEVLSSFSEKRVACNAMRSRDAPTKYSVISKCTWPGFHRSRQDLERAWAMFLSEMLGAIFRKMAIRTLVSSILRKRTKIFTSSGHHLSGIWLFSLRSFTAAHLPVCRKRCVIIWMR